MIEQKQNQQEPQKSDQRDIQKGQMTRREFLVKAGKVTGGVILAGGLARFLEACADGETDTTKKTDMSTTTTKEVPTTTVTTKPPETTNSPTTEAPTTTTTEKEKVGIDPELMVEGESYKDVVGKIPEGKYLTLAEDAAIYKEGEYIVVDSENIPIEIQSLFQAEQPVRSRGGKAEIVLLGSNNDPNKEGFLRDAITSKYAISSTAPTSDDGFYDNYVGSSPKRESIWEDPNGRASKANGVFMGFVPAISPEEPETKDLYMKIYAPVLDKTFYGRIVFKTEAWDKKRSYLTAFSILSLKEKIQTQVSGNERIRFVDFLEKNSASKLLQLGDKVSISFNVADTEEMMAAVDVRGVQLISNIEVQRFNEKDVYEISSLIYSK